MTIPTTPAPDPTAAGPLAEEPVAIFLAGLASVVGLGLAAATALDWVPLTAEQTALIVAFVVGVTGLAASVIRAKVWSPASVADLVGPR